jgi:ATP-dependent helicase HepA
MKEIVPGQRWVCASELQLGLGTVLAVEPRTVTLAFPASGETRTYARHTAPLNRVGFGVGDRVRDVDGRALAIEAINERDGLLTYHGVDDCGVHAVLPETRLDPSLRLNRPAERLFSGQIDTDKWFELRYQTLQHNHRLAHSDLHGLLGCRTSLLTHQLYIAHEVAARHAPRVLLADEVGLGKTIEAGLILHHQLLTGRARRVLIVVPEALLHQWLVEMLRRFNLLFSLFDGERCAAVAASAPDGNPFLSEQLVLCSLTCLCDDPQRLDEAVRADWDLLVVDEAHHLAWTPQHTSREYAAVAALAARSPGVLLLTATPEQLGKAGHFARLRLLDNDRFPDLDSFLAEEQRYAPVAHAVEVLLGDAPLDDATQRILAGTLAEGDNRALLDALNQTAPGKADNRAARRELVEHLLDRHGTGRVLFRNTRSAVQGFPPRLVHPSALVPPPDYAHVLAQARPERSADPGLLACPDQLYQSAAGRTAEHWTQIDPRVPWLIDLLNARRPEKVLVIAARAVTVRELAQALRTSAGIQAAVFDEQMSIVERDRAAAFFADAESGSQVLLCSEIGSEGRNFQFAHHLVLFDLPLDPDVLEQRIGRLDRIGQSGSIHLHVPYLEGTAQAVLFHWYLSGLAAFEHSCPAAQSVLDQLRPALLDALRGTYQGLAELRALIDSTRALHERLQQALHEGRDRLLEYNSCRPHAAQALQQRASAADQPAHLSAFMDSVFECFNVDSEEQGPSRLALRPGTNMIGSFPALKDDGMTVTFDRSIALAHEDLEYLTWEHPMVTGAMELVLSHELGNTALITLHYPGAARGKLLLECVFLLETPTAATLQSDRYLPPTALRVVVDENGTAHQQHMQHAMINRYRDRVDTATAQRVVAARETLIRGMLDAAQQLAQAQVPELQATAHRRAERTLRAEIDRLEALRRINPNVREEEIRFFAEQLRTLDSTLDRAALRLDALRVIVVT